jgi:hypothetical protein
MQGNIEKLSDMSDTGIQIHSPLKGWDIVGSGIGLSYRPASLCSLAGRYGNPMPELTFPPSQGLWIYVASEHWMTWLSFPKISRDFAKTEKSGAQATKKFQKGIGQIRSSLQVDAVFISMLTTKLLRTKSCMGWGREIPPPLFFFLNGAWFWWGQIH